MSPFQKKSGPPPMPKRGGAQMSAKEEMPASVETTKAPAPEVAAPTTTEPTPVASSVSISPDAVCFSTGDERCKTCAHMQQDGMCAVLNMPVEPEDHCRAHSDREDGASDMEMPPQ